MHLDVPTLSTQSARSQVVRPAIIVLIATGILTLLAGSSSRALAASTSPSAQPSASPSATKPSTPGGKAAPAPVTFGIGPAATSAGVGLRSSFSFGVTPGAQASDKVTVFNYSLVPLQLAVYTVQAENTKDGAIGFSSATAAPVDIASWLSVGTSRPAMVNVPGRSDGSKPPGEVTLPVRLAVPLNAEPGDHVGGVVAALAVKSNNPKGEQVTLEQRVVTRVYVRVSGPLHPKLEIVGLHATYHQQAATAKPQPKTGGLSIGAGSTTVTYTVHNAGNVRVQASQTVKVAGLLFGSSKAVHPDDIAQLLPGGSSTVTVVVPGVWPTVLVRPNVRVVPSAITGDVDPELKPLSASTWTWAVPWALVIVLVILGVVEWQRRRRRKLRRAPVVPAATAAAAAPVVSRVAAADVSGRHRVGAMSGRKSRHGR